MLAAFTPPRVTAQNWIRRGSFFSVQELVQAIKEFLDENNPLTKAIHMDSECGKDSEKVNRCSYFKNKTLAFAVLILQFA